MASDAAVTAFDTGNNLPESPPPNAKILLGLLKQRLTSHIASMPPKKVVDPAKAALADDSTPAKDGEKPIQGINIEVFTVLSFVDLDA